MSKPTPRPTARRTGVPIEPLRRHWFEPNGEGGPQAARFAADPLALRRLPCNRRKAGLTLKRSGRLLPAASGAVRPRSLVKEDQKTIRGIVFPTNAIQACLTLKALFGLPLRQTTGLVASLLELAGLDWPVPDFSTLCRPLPGR